MSERVPAWKRLGLTLKYAKAQPDSAEISLFQGSKHKRVDDDKSQSNGSQHTERPTKRRRTTQDGPAEAAHANGHVNGQRNHEASRQLSQETEKGSRPTKRKKSVSFTGDTKIDDGDSRVTIDFPAGSPGSTPMRPKQGRSDNFETDGPATPSPADGVRPTEGQPEASSPSNDIRPKKQKTGHKSAKNQKGQQSNSNKKPVASLEYLEQHRSDRTSWKFNKTRDIWILNHAHSVDQIPRSYDLALAGYIRGLPQKAAARDRLVQECKETLHDMEQQGSSSADAENHKSAFLQQISEEASSKAETSGGLEAWLETQPRPRLILWALGVEEEPTETTRGTAETKETKILTPIEKKKLKKSRTAAPIDISSSSESDSDSDSLYSSSSNPDSKKSGVSMEANRLVTNGNDDTSSAGTSSSSEAGETSSSEESTSEASSDSE